MRRRRTPSRTGELRALRGSALEEVLAAAIALDPRDEALCAQVRRALDHALGAECRDEALHDLQVLEVWPDPTTRRLRVWLRGSADLDESRRMHVLDRLAAARGFLRARVAEAIHRKRTPELVFELVVGATGDTEGSE